MRQPSKAITAEVESAIPKHEDLQEAWASYAALQVIFMRPRGPRDAGLLPAVMDACLGAWTSVDNEHFRQRIVLLARHANLLMSPGVHELRIAVLNDRIANLLQSCRGWLRYLESVRAGGWDATCQPISGRESHEAQPNAELGGRADASGPPQAFSLAARCVVPRRSRN